jgi:hypothetical protein
MTYSAITGLTKQQPAAATVLQTAAAVLVLR